MSAPIVTVATAVLEVVKILGDQARKRNEPVPEALRDAERDLTDVLAAESARRAEDSD